ncbi:RDD family protein [uncultured Nocardioides sp.]|uniref:RDD family protein n=1 Tax=uncultured Nocardioides sp. TaxID=198441 RepID=UPI002626B4D4|nr:RDD family protein [uncultured Nocardioides sp.]
MSTASAEEASPPAGLERRFLAFTLDRLVAWTAYAGFGVLAWWVFWRDGETWPGVGVLLGGVVLVAGGLAVLAGLTGTSPGRAATGLRLVDADSGEPLGVGRSLLRALVLGAATLPTFGFGVATLAWTAVSDPGHRRRGWHDRRTGSVVVDTRPPPEEDDEEVEELPRQMVNLTAMRLVPSTSSAPAPAPEPTPAPAPAPAPRPERTPPPQPAARPPGDPGAPAPRPEKQQLQGPLRPDTDTGPGPGSDTGPDAAPGDLGTTGGAPERPTPAPSGTAVAAAPAGTAVPPDRPGRHRGRDRGRGRSGAAPAAPAPPRWEITFDTGESLLVEGVVLVGRRPEPRPGEQVRHVVALPSQDMSLSKTHAQLHLADGVLVVMDRGSTNGSVLNRRGVARDLAPSRPTTLVDGDKVRFGDREMQVVKRA